MSALRRLYAPTPQTLLAFPVSSKPELNGLAKTRAEIARAEGLLRGRGRVFVRYSGTEPALRVLVEGPDTAENAKIAAEIGRVYFSETGMSEEAHS